jgi:archaellum component FlaF (FlaF/FlaG flagellin family)
MGLNALAAGLAVGFVTLLILYAGAQTHSDNLQAAQHLRERALILEFEARTSIEHMGFNSTNTTNTVINTTVYVKNTGATSVDPSCAQLFLNGEYINPNIMSYTVLPGIFSRGLWEPTETLALSFQKELEVKEHNLTFTGCGRDSHTKAFNATKCGDNTCLGGEYCPIEDILCDLLCYHTACHNGCAQTLIPAGGMDHFGPLYCNETGGCATGDCVCDGEGGCCGAEGSACTQNTDCCSGICDMTCSAYP